jgi:transposase InsO family protein
MPWNEVTIVSQRKEFVMLAQAENTNISRLCRRFKVSRKTGYKWLRRFEQKGAEALHDHSRRPRSSPWMTESDVETAVKTLRQKYPSWGGRKLKKRLSDLGYTHVPAASTITAILSRNGLLDPGESLKHSPCQRFEAEAPNDLWQMDFKGHFPIANGRCHPLTLLDDHSRYALGLEACEHQRGLKVQACLRNIFRRYGLPLRILADHGAPWGSDSSFHTVLSIWLMQLGVEVIHGRIYHPQTQGKIERFHRTLQAEVVPACCQLDLRGCQHRFDAWRQIYNLERPHEALGFEVPASRYRESFREFPEVLPAVEYEPGQIVRKVHIGGYVSYHGVRIRVGKAFYGQHVALWPTNADGVMDIFFSHYRIAQINLKEHDQLW